MPSTEGLELLVRRTQPDYGEWLELLEARKRMLRPYLDMVSLGKLGDIKCLKREENQPKGFREDHPIVQSSQTEQGDTPFTLDTQGIFSAKWVPAFIPHSGYQAPPGGVSSPDGVVHFWGLTRSARWILVRVEFRGHPGYKNRGVQVASAVIIQETTPARIVEKMWYTAQEIWLELGRAVHNWLLDRQRLYLQIEETSHQIAMEERALSVIPAESN